MIWPLQNTQVWVYPADFSSVLGFLFVGFLSVAVLLLVLLLLFYHCSLFSPQSFFCFLMPRAFFPFFPTTDFLHRIPFSSDLASNAAAVHLNFVVIGREKNGVLAHGLWMSLEASMWFSSFPVESSSSLCSESSYVVLGELSGSLGFLRFCKGLY